MAVLVIGSFGLTSFPGLGPRGTGATSYKDGVGEPQPPETESATHVSLGASIEYGTGPPPAWGDHWPFTSSVPTGCGFYEDGVADEAVVHNMEHGHVIMSYNLNDAAQVQRLRDVHDRLGANQDWLVTRFYDKIEEGEIALTAWGVLDRFAGIDEERIKRFYNAYRGNRFSPETQSVGRGLPCTSTV